MDGMSMPWVSYAPNYEDVTLMRALGDIEHGCYVDVGAGDPRVDSVTRAFYERGWRGVNIEPLGQWHERLATDRPGDVNLRLLASASDGQARLFELDGTGRATADPGIAQRYADQGNAVREIVVPARRLDGVCDQLDLGEIHFLRIGAQEGQSEALDGIDLDRTRPWVVVLRSPGQEERSEQVDAWDRLLTARRYRCVWFDGLNLFYLADERQALAARLALPPNAHDRFVRYTERVLQDEVIALRSRVSTADAGRQEAEDAEGALDADEALRRTYLPMPAIHRRAHVAAAGTMDAGTERGTHARLFVDLQCVHGPQGEALLDSVVAAVEALGIARPALEIVCGLVADPGRDDSWARAALERVVPADRIVAYALPVGLDRNVRAVAEARRSDAAAAVSWRHRVAELLREDFIAGIGADAAWIPGLEDPADPVTVQSDARALASALGRRVDQALTNAIAAPAARPRLAVVAPLPPIDSDVARFCAIVLPDLARHYDIDVIGSQSMIAAAGVAECCRLRSIAWFETNARLYDRIVYHVACSRLHEHAFALLERHPGTVVLHDLDLSALYAHLERAELEPGCLQRALYVSHGWPALRERATRGPHDAPATWPASKEVFDAADGVIVATEREAHRALALYGRNTPVRVGGRLPEAGDAGCLADQVAEAHRQAIEAFHATGRHARQRRLGAAIAAIGAPELSLRHTQAEIARCIVANQPVARQRQLLVDITFLSLQNLRTGIQRVVRSVLNLLLSRSIDGYRVEPVVLTPGGFVYARAATAAILGLDLGIRFPEREFVETAAGDVFLGLDWNYHLGAHWPEAQFNEWRARGVRFEFVVYDLLPLQLPYSVPGPDFENFRRWAMKVCSGADRLVCISKSVADEVLAAMPELAPDRARGPAVEWFHLGADIQASLPSGGVTPAEQALLQRLSSRKSFLMVGTVEPRKGHAVTLDAMERLWRQGVDVDLVIVGRPGWMVDALIARIRSHPESGNRLSWLERASDEALGKLYQTCSAVLMASEGEGFGLPLIEAAMHGLPIIARDIPVFREIAGEHAYFWQAADAGPQVGLARPRRDAEVLEADAAALAEALVRWLALHALGRSPAPEGIRWITWEDSTLALLRIVFGPDAELVDPAPNRLPTEEAAH